MRRTLVLLAILGFGAPPWAQQSASFRLEEHAFNAAGHPDGSSSPTSSGFHVSLDAVGDCGSPSALSSASFHMDAGFVRAYPPPGEVSGLVFADRQTLEWNPERAVGTYNLYRDRVSSLAGLGFGGCWQQDLPGPTATDNDPVPSSDGFFYLPTAKNRLDEEGTKGFRSDGTERQGTACP